MIRQLKHAEVEQIANWKYINEYSKYNREYTETHINELTNGDYFTAYNNAFQLYGYYYFKKLDDGYIEAKFYMKPTICGVKLGETFCNTAIEFIKNKFNTNKIRLKVEESNIRATKLFTKLGFKEKGLETIDNEKYKVLEF